MIKKSKSSQLILLFLILGAFLFPVNIQASGLHSLSDKMTRHAPITGSDHEIKFTTPSGVTEVGQYISLVFDVGFDLSNIDHTDIDLSYGPGSGLENDADLNSSASLTEWGVSVGINQIDFNHPTDASLDISSGDKVVIKIGLNTSYQAIGDQQIINPATIGSKIVTITGNFGDIGKLAVPIAQDQILVGGQTASAPPTPVILNPPYNITSTSMDLSWSTNTDLDFDRYELYYSTSPGVDNITGTLAVTYTNRLDTSYSLAGLTQDTTYYFVVYVFDTEALSSPSNEVSGTTLTGGIHVPPDVPEPFIYQRICPIFLPDYEMNGWRPENHIIFVNGSTDGVNYPDPDTWTKMVSLNLGDNIFELFARSPMGYNSDLVNEVLVRWRVGDTNGNFIVDDYDLSGLAAHFWTDWCYADFNEDYFVDDFDLSGLAANWDNVY